MTKSRLIFFGNEQLATGTATTRPLLTMLVHSGYAVTEVQAGRQTNEQLVQTVNQLKPQAGVLAAYGKILPESIINLFPAGVINLHPSLLPRYRGPTPIETAILDGTAQTGVSLMALVKEMDAGPVYAQEKLKLAGTETKQQLADQLSRLGAELLTRSLPDILTGTLKARPQAGKPSYTRLIAKSDGQIDWNKPADALEREIRAYAGWPGSFARLGSKDVIITQAHAVPSNDPLLKPGDIEAMKDIGVIKIECANGYLCIERLKPAGKKEMSAAEFIRGYAASAGF